MKKFILAAVLALGLTVMAACGSPNCDGIIRISNGVMWCYHPIGSGGGGGGGGSW